MKKFGILFLVLMLITFSFNTNIVEISAEDKKLEDIEVRSNAAIVIDADNGMVLYSKNADKKLYPASITKIMTVILAIENLDMNDKALVTANAIDTIDPESSHIALTYDEEVNVFDLCNAVMLASANDGANVLAEKVSGSIDAFVDLMNKKAQELGCTNTHFNNANGLPDENHYTSCADMAKITAYAVKNETFLKIFSTVSYTTKEPTNKLDELRVFANGNDMIKQGKYYRDYAVGGKNGWTPQANYTLVTYASKNNLNLVAVTMDGQSREDRYLDTMDLLDFMYDNYSKVIIEKEMIIPRSYEFYEEDQLSKKITFDFDYDIGILVKNGTKLDQVTYDMIIENEDNPELINGKLSISIDGQHVGDLEIEKNVENFEVIHRNLFVDSVNYLSIGLFVMTILVFIYKMFK